MSGNYKIHLLRAAIWSGEENISLEDIKEALIPMALSGEDNLLNMPIKDGINLQEIMGKVAQHYLKKALDEANGNKTKAAQLVGLPNYQTFTNWLQKHNLI